MELNGFNPLGTSGLSLIENVYVSRLKNVKLQEGKMQREIYYNLTVEGHQELILARIKNLKWKCECIHEQMDGMEQRAAELDMSSMSVVLEELQSEWNDFQMDLYTERNRLIRLRGSDENGSPF